MGNELSTSAAQQDWSEEQVAAQMKALFDFDGYLASPSPSPGAPSSDLCVDTPENASRPSDGFHPPGEMSPAFCCCPLPMLPAQHPPAAAPTSIAPAPDTQATSVSVPPPMGLKMPPLDVSSPHHMQLPGPPAQAPTLSAYTISFQTPILQDEHTHVPGMAPELTPLGTKALARESLVDRSHDVLKASGAPGFIAGRPMYQPMSNVGQKHPNQRKYTPKRRVRLSTSKKLRNKPSVVRRLGVQRSVAGSVFYGGACRLDIAKLGGDGAYRCIPDHDMVAFPDQTFKQKVSFRLDLEGYAPFHRQLNVLLGGRQPTKGRLAEVTARFVECFIEHCEEQGRPFQYRLEHIVLRRIDLVSRSSIQPFFDFLTLAIA